MPNTKDRIGRAVTWVHEGLFKGSGGRIGGRVMGMPALVLTTTGRKSGEARSTMLTYFEDGADVVLVASWGGDDRHPNWYQNLVAKPEVLVNRTAKGDEPMTARTATAEEKARLWPIITATYKGYAGYQEKTTREIPLVMLTPSAG